MKISEIGFDNDVSLHVTWLRRFIATIKNQKKTCDSLGGLSKEVVYQNNCMHI